MKVLLVLFTTLFLFACSPTQINAYQSDVNQGSDLNRFQVNQLTLGMSKQQVRDLIGSPSIIDPFHNNQWHYINHTTLFEKDDIHYQLTLIFKGTALSYIDTSKMQSLAQLNKKEQALENKRLGKQAPLFLAQEKVDFVENSITVNHSPTKIQKTPAIASTKTPNISAPEPLAISAPEPLEKIKTIKVKKPTPISAPKPLKTLTPVKPKILRYVVKKGDSLWQIARMYKTTVARLSKDNKIKNSAFVRIGQVLLIIK
jgi:outer membrane protein assembly factor BamE